MKYLLCLSASLIAAAPALAQDASDDIVVADMRVRDTAITVVGTGLPEPIEQSGQSLGVISAAELDSIQGPDLARALERFPGVAISRNGGVGAFTGMRVRGADAEQLLVVIDGVRMADAAAPAGGYDLGALMAGEVQRLDLLRGSNSVVWGSQAMGGVLSVITRNSNGITASGEYGAHDSGSAEVTAGHGNGSYHITVSAGYVRSDGVSSAASGTEADPSRQWHIHGRGWVALTDRLTAEFTTRHADSRLDIDGYPAPFYSFADTPEYQTAKETAGRAGLQWQDEGFNLSAGYSLSDTRRSYFDPTFGTASNYDTFGLNQRADLTGSVVLPAGFGLTFGADSEWSRFHTSFDAEHKARLSSGHALLTLSSGALALSGGVRLDDHSRFGSHWSLGANGSVALGAGWRLRASYGEGFKAPTLFQLLSDYGNAALRPETSRSVDAGIELGDRNADLHFALTAFRRDSRDLIDFVSCWGVTTGICTGRPFGTYDNISRARAEGIEIEADARPVQALALHAAYSYVKATSRATGNDLARRPRHALTLAADWTTPLAGLALGGDLRMVSDSFDDAGNFTRMDGHALVTLRASLPLGEHFELYGRIENLGNVRYQSAAGYGTAGRSAFAGARVRF